MIKTALRKTRTIIIATSFCVVIPMVHAADHLHVVAPDQSVKNGSVMAATVVASDNGWLVVHKTDEAMKPGPVIGHAPVSGGVNNDVAVMLSETVEPGQLLMLMLHGEDGGSQEGVFEYTLGSKLDGPVREDGKLITDVITIE